MHIKVCDNYHIDSMTFDLKVRIKKKTDLHLDLNSSLYYLMRIIV